MNVKLWLRGYVEGFVFGIISVGTKKCNGGTARVGTSRLLLGIYVYIQHALVSR